MGVGNLASRQPMQVNDPMRIGSITKTLTGTVILQLVDQHKLRLDDSVSTYQPEVPNGNHITNRPLSGLFNYSEDEAFVQALLTDPYKAWAPQALVAIAFKHPPYFAPGKGFHYSNTNTVLLGMIMQQLTHLPAEQAFQRSIFGPLGMHQSFLPPRSSSAIPDPHAQGYMYGTELYGQRSDPQCDGLEPLRGLDSRVDDLDAARSADLGQSPGYRPVAQRGLSEAATDLGNLRPHLAGEAPVLWAGGDRLRRVSRA
jgi:CubicO group peptidase (beta-lactamase class C family)